jgi:hypothetical protein
LLDEGIAESGHGTWPGPMNTFGERGGQDVTIASHRILADRMVGGFNILAGNNAELSPGEALSAR